MSAYSNKPQNNTWILWFLTSITLLLLMLVWGTNATELPVIYDALLFLIFVNLIYCIITGFKLK